MFASRKPEGDYGSDGDVPLWFTFGWQFTIAQVFKIPADEGYFPKIFSRVTKADALVQGMLAIASFSRAGLSLMTISPSLNSQF